MLRSVTALLMTLLILAACNITPDATPTPPADPAALLEDVIDTVQELESFQMLIEQRGAEYAFMISLDAGNTEVQAVMRRGEVQYVTPDEMYASVNLRVAGLPNVGLEMFIQGPDQWFKLAGSNWIEYRLAEGFDPGRLIQNDSGIPRALHDLERIEYVGAESLQDGTPVHHIRGTATGELITDLLFGLLTVQQEVVTVNVFVNRETLIPTVLTMTLPDTATEDEPRDTEWRIEIYDINADPIFAYPEGADARE